MLWDLLDNMLYNLSNYGLVKMQLILTGHRTDDHDRNTEIIHITEPDHFSPEQPVRPAG